MCQHLNRDRKCDMADKIGHDPRFLAPCLLGDCTELDCPWTGKPVTWKPDDSTYAYINPDCERRPKREPEGALVGLRVRGRNPWEMEELL